MKTYPSRFCSMSLMKLQVCVRGSTVMIGQKFEDCLVKGTHPPPSSLRPFLPPPPGVCIMIDARDSLCLIATIDERAPARISLQFPIFSSDSLAAHAQQAAVEPLV
jgi:hypothetical protein